MYRVAEGQIEVFDEFFKINNMTLYGNYDLRIIQFY